MNQEWEIFLNRLSHDPYLFKVDEFMPSAWIGHAPILKFVIREMQPESFVELGVHNGFSYFVGCQSIVENSLNTQAFAIDHWLGDSQAGYFDETVFASVVQHNEKFKSFSKLLKMEFSEALKEFDSKSIDLLHIDGFHSYESVKSDFESWLPKMASDGIILLHDIHVRRNSFGVYKFWEEVKARYSTIEFPGSHGLGVVNLGDLRGEMKSLYEIVVQGNLAAVQGTFGSISDDILQSSTNPKILNLTIYNSNLIAERDGLVAERDGLVAERDGLVAERDGLVAERDLVKHESNLIKSSTIWKVSLPYRLLVRKIRNLLN